MVSVPVPQWSAQQPVPRKIPDVSIVHAPSELHSAPAASVATTQTIDELRPVAPSVQAAPIPWLTWQSWLVAVWLAVIAVQLRRVARQSVRLRRLLAQAVPANEAVQSLLAECTRKLRLTNAPEVRITEAEVSPFVCGVTRPVLVLPTSLLSTSSALQLRQIVLHELAHVRRSDLRWCWVTYVSRMVYWFHPVAHWLVFREALERELACDELAMSHSGATAAEYARTLVDAVSRISKPVVLRAIAAHLDGGCPIDTSVENQIRAGRGSLGE
jgi:beta-lactamase regulating signal transducer with metallopeptidase domain